MSNDEMIRRQNNRAKATALLEVCRRARREINAALDQLGSARNWGIWDMIGGKFPATVIKHHRINQASEHLDLASRELRQLSSELKQVFVNANLAPDIGGFAVFADFVFDDIFSALYVQGRIRELQQKLQSTLRELDRVEAALRKM